MGGYLRLTNSPRHNSLIQCLGTHFWYWLRLRKMDGQ